MRRILGLVTVLALSAALTACSDSTPTDGSTETGIPATDGAATSGLVDPTTPDVATAPAEPTTDPSEPTSAACEFTPGGETTQSDNFPIAGGDLIMTEIDQVSPDRIELILEGNDTPEWQAGYTDEPAHPASGEPIVLESPFVLELALWGFTYPDEDWDLTVPNDNIRFAAPFEGGMNVFIGRSAEQDYCVIPTDDGLAIEFRAD